MRVRESCTPNFGEGVQVHAARPPCRASVLSSGMPILTRQTSLPADSNVSIPLLSSTPSQEGRRGGVNLQVRGVTPSILVRSLASAHPPNEIDLK